MTVAVTELVMVSAKGRPTDVELGFPMEPTMEVALESLLEEAKVRCLE